MSEPQSNSSAMRNDSNLRTIIFMVILSIVCALILSLLASALAEPKEIAKDLDRSKQMMIAAKILDYNGYFLLRNEQNQYVPAKYDPATESLVPGTKEDIATQEQLLKVYAQRFVPLLTNKAGEIKTFEEAGINLDNYVNDFRKEGYYIQPWKLVYKMLPNPQDGKKVDPQGPADGWVIPVNGFGLWDAIYGYLALEPNANTILGISWYDQKETPGLGANIAEPYWQDLFPGKHIFQETAGGKTNYENAPLGITVVKGKVSEVLGNSPKAKSAVDGMTGATITGNGVTDAYKNVLSAYRPFLIKIHQEDKQEA